MKRFAVLAMLVAMVLSVASAASAAVDLEAKGRIQFQFNIYNNWSGGSLFKSSEKLGTHKGDSTEMVGRARARFRFIANENLMGELYTESKVRFGRTGEAALGDGSSDRALGVKQFFIQFRIPETEVLTTAGLIAPSHPSADFGPAVLGDAEMGTFLVQAKLMDQLDLTAGYIRAVDTQNWTRTDGVNRLHDEFDAFMLALPVTVDGFKFQPYGIMAVIGQDTYSALPASLASTSSVAFTDNAFGWWGGFGFSMDMFDPIVFNLDFVYGSVDADQKRNDRSGYLVDASVAYTGLDMMTPKLVFAYASGEDSDTTDGSERLPIINNDWAIGSFYFGGTALTDGDINAENSGFWTIGLALEDISFLEKLSHTLNVLYIAGTNDSDLIKGQASGTRTGVAPGWFLTDEDSLIEVDFNTKYKLFEELSAIVEFGYIFENIDNDTWEAWDAGSADAGEFSDAMKLLIGLRYDF